MKKTQTIKIGGIKVNVKDMAPNLRSKIEEQLGEKIGEVDDDRDVESIVENEGDDKEGQTKPKKTDTSLFRKMFGFGRRKRRKNLI